MERQSGAARGEVGEGGVNGGEAVGEGSGLAGVPRETRELLLEGRTKIKTGREFPPEQTRRDDILQKTEPRKISPRRIVAPDLAPSAGAVAVGEADQQTAAHGQRSERRIGPARRPRRQRKCLNSINNYRIHGLLAPTFRRFGCKTI